MLDICDDIYIFGELCTTIYSPLITQTSHFFGYMARRRLGREVHDTCLSDVNLESLFIQSSLHSRSSSPHKTSYSKLLQILLQFHIPNKLHYSPSFSNSNQYLLFWPQLLQYNTHISDQWEYSVSGGLQRCLIGSRVNLVHADMGLLTLQSP